MKGLNTKAKVGLTIIILLAAVALFAPFIATADPAVIDLPNRLQAPGQAGLLGTDHLGRDVFTRLIFGARVSMAVVLIILAISIVLGSILGLVVGYYRGIVDHVVMGVVEVLLAFPSMILALVVIGVLGAGLTNAIIAICLVSWIGYTRVVRGLTLSIKERDFVKAAKLSGSSNFKIIIQHILPNVITATLVYAATNISSIIMQVAGLSFLGLGVQAPLAEWGNMLNEAKGFITVAPWLILAPSAALVIMITGFNLFGEGLSESLNSFQQLREDD